MKIFYRMIKLMALIVLTMQLTSCSDPQVYGSVGVSSGYSSYGGYHGGSGSRMRGSISVGGRIR
ncbi:MAG: hypothetical protein V7711_15405 [Pseudomonadales bacterium]